MAWRNLFMGWLSLPTPSLCMIPLREPEISKMPCEEQRKLSKAKPLTLLRGKKGKLLHPRRAHWRNLLTLISRGSWGKRNYVSLVKSHRYRDIDVLLEEHNILKSSLIARRKREMMDRGDVTALVMTRMGINHHPEKNKEPLLQPMGLLLLWEECPSTWP